MSEMRVERRWTGSAVEYVLHTPNGAVVTDLATLSGLTAEIHSFRYEEDEFVSERQAVVYPPSRFGLVPRADDAGAPSPRVFVRVGAQPGDPLVVWKGSASGGTWDLVPAWWEVYGRFGSLPALSSAAWDDPEGVADVCRLAEQPEMFATLYALAHPESVRARQEWLVQHEQQIAAQAVRQRNAEAWPVTGALAEVKPRVLREVVQPLTQALHPNGLLASSLPLDPLVLLADPDWLARTGLAEDEISVRHMIGGHAKTNDQYPVAGWLLTLDPPSADTPVVSGSPVTALAPAQAPASSTAIPPAASPPPALPPSGDDAWPDPAWLVQAQAAAANAGLRLVHRPDGVWLIRDEAVFDIVHATRDPDGPQMKIHIIWA